MLVKICRHISTSHEYRGTVCDGTSLDCPPPPKKREFAEKFVDEIKIRISYQTHFHAESRPIIR